MLSLCSDTASKSLFLIYILVHRLAGRGTILFLKEQRPNTSRFGNRSHIFSRDVGIHRHTPGVSHLLLTRNKITSFSQTTYCTSGIESLIGIWQRTSSLEVKQGVTAWAGVATIITWGCWPLETLLMEEMEQVVLDRSERKERGEGRWYKWSLVSTWIRDGQWHTFLMTPAAGVAVGWMAAWVGILAPWVYDSLSVNMQAMQWWRKKKNTYIMSHLGVNLEYRLFDNKWRKYTLIQNKHVNNGNPNVEWHIYSVETSRSTS